MFTRKKIAKVYSGQKKAKPAKYQTKKIKSKGCSKC